MVTIPRPITGNVGSRIRLVFGDGGNEWLLILDHDNGDRKWQETQWTGGIPAAVAKQINNCEAKGREIKAVDFGPDGAWFVNGVKADGSGSYSWWGNTSSGEDISKEQKEDSIKVSFGTTSYDMETCVVITGRNGYHYSGGTTEELTERIERINGRNKAINFVRMFDEGQFFISDDEGMQWQLGNKHLRDELAKSGAIEEVAVAGDESWVVIRGNRFASSTGVDDELVGILSNFFAGQRRWISQRKREIREAREEEERERLAQERATLAAVEAVQQQLDDYHERVSRERAAAEAEERAERERIQREAREAELAEREERESSSRISSLETQLVNRLAEEADNIREAKASLESRTRSLRIAVQSLPESARGRVSLDGIEEADSASNSVCVACHDEPAVMAAAPCGHVCLCSDCSGICMNGGTATRQCPMCRTTMQSVLRIYLGSGRS